MEIGVHLGYRQILFQLAGVNITPKIVCSHSDFRQVSEKSLFSLSREFYRNVWFDFFPLSHFQNLNQNKRTLLPKFYGLYCVQAAGKNIRIVVMNNLLPSSVRMHLKYDLKGSTYKRRASAKERDKNVPTFKDLDFMQDMPEGLLLEGDKYSAVCKTIHRDCLVIWHYSNDIDYH